MIPVCFRLSGRHLVFDEMGTAKLQTRESDLGTICGEATTRPKPEPAGHHGAYVFSLGFLIRYRGATYPIESFHIREQDSGGLFPGITVVPHRLRIQRWRRFSSQRCPYTDCDLLCFGQGNCATRHHQPAKSSTIRPLTSFTDQ